MVPVSDFLSLQAVDGAEAHTVVQLQGEIVGLQSSLFSSQLQLEASQRAHRQSQRVADDLEQARSRLHNDLEAALQHRETTDKHNQVNQIAVRHTVSESFLSITGELQLD